MPNLPFLALGISFSTAFLSLSPSAFPIQPEVKIEVPGESKLRFRVAQCFVQCYTANLQRNWFQTQACVTPKTLSTVSSCLQRSSIHSLTHPHCHQLCARRTHAWHNIRPWEHAGGPGGSHQGLWGRAPHSS